MIEDTAARIRDDVIDAENRVAYLIFMYCDKPETLERQVDLLIGIGTTDVCYVED